MGLGVILAACEGLGMYQKIGMVDCDSFEEEQRKEVRIFIPIILFWWFGGKKSTPNESSDIIFEYHHDSKQKSTSILLQTGFGKHRLFSFTRTEARKIGLE